MRVTDTPSSSDTWKAAFITLAILIPALVLGAITVGGLMNGGDQAYQQDSPEGAAERLGLGSTAPRDEATPRDEHATGALDTEDPGVPAERTSQMGGPPPPPDTSIEVLEASPQERVPRTTTGCSRYAVAIREDPQRRGCA